jgi:hypothetical protein
MRKSIRVAPGVRLNVSKRGMGMSVGAGGVRYSVHSSGRRTVSARTGIPGVSYQEGVGGGRSGGGSGTRALAPRPVAPPAAKKPGLFAPKGEKQLYNAVKAQDAHAMRRVGEEDPAFRLASYSLAGLLLLGREPETAACLLEEAFATGEDPASDRFVSTYLLTRVELTIAAG